MSKKKNTLKDLDAFLKQQAATLVAPDPLTTKTEAPAPKPESAQLPPVKAEAVTPPVETTPTAPTATPTPETAVETPAVTPVAVTIPSVQPEPEITAEKILGDLSRLADREGEGFRKTLYDLIIRSLETRTQSLPEDKMLINTALYLKSGDQWKDVIREYWKQQR